MHASRILLFGEVAPFCPSTRPGRISGAESAAAEPARKRRRLEECGVDIRRATDIFRTPRFTQPLSVIFPAGAYAFGFAQNLTEKRRLATLRKIMSALRLLCLLLPLIAVSAPRLHADGAADNLSENVRRMPPAGVAIPEEVRAPLTAETARLAAAIAETREQLKDSTLR